MPVKPDAKTKGMGYITHDVIDKFGRLLLAEGSLLTPERVRKLEEQGIQFHVAAEPLGRKQGTCGGKQFVFEVPKQLEQKFIRLDLESVAGASKYLNGVLHEIKAELSLCSYLKVLAQGHNATYSHSINVSLISCAIGRKMNLSKPALHELALGALYHDIGTILLPSPVLKAAPDGPAGQNSVYQQHTRLGADLLAADKFAKGIFLVAQQHHENYSGTGYPQGIKGGNIHLHAAIAGVANVFDNLTSTGYPAGLRSPDEAIQEILSGSEIIYHPRVVESFVALFKK